MKPRATAGHELAFVILNYRTPQLSADCLDSIAAQLQPSLRAIIVDNDSRDGSALWLEQHIAAHGYQSWAQVVRSPCNGGFAAGNNLGIGACDASVYVLLNSDTLLRPGAIAELRSALASREDVGIVGPSFEDGAGVPLDSCFHTDPHPLGELVRAANSGPVARLLRKYERPPERDIHARTPAWLPFACVAIRRDVFTAIGPLDEGYFMYFEDVDFCRRARAAGFSLLYWPRARVVHLVGQSSQVTAEGTAYRRAPRYYYAARTRYFVKHFGEHGLLWANVAWLVGRALSGMRKVLQPDHQAVREGELWDIWTDVYRALASGLDRTPAVAEQSARQP
ncbi:MAG TPA: glycosyltransferase family 2 protein [Polyangiales bacterium]